MAQKVAGELYESLTGQLLEIGRQLRQSNGYPFDPAQLQKFLQRAVEGKFVDRPVVKPKFDVLADGTITFTVTSDGTTGLEWIDRLKAAGHKVNDYAEQLLRSSDFVPTNGMTTKSVVLLNKLWTTDSNRLTKNIRAEADKRKQVKPNAEVACLVRKMFTNEEIRSMGLLRLVIMHESIKDADGRSGLLAVSADDSESWLDAFWDSPAYQWSSQSGFVFAVPQV